MDTKLSKTHNINIVDNEHMEATVEGKSSDIAKFLISCDYGQTVEEVSEQFPELRAALADIKL